MAVIRGYHRNAKGLSKGEERLVHLVLLRYAVFLELQVKPVLEYARIGFCQRPCLLFIVFEKGMCNLAMEAGRQGYYSLVEFGQQFLVHPGLVVEAFKIGQGHEFKQVFIAGIVHCQKYQVIGCFTLVAGALVLPVAGCDIYLTADKGFYAGLDGLLVELQDPVHATVIRNGKTAISVFFCPWKQILQSYGAIQQAVFGV